MLAHEGESVLRPHSVDDLHRLFQPRLTFLERREVQAIRHVIIPGPCGADAHVQTPVADDVYGAAYLGQHSGMPIGDAGYHAPQPQALGYGGQCREDGPGLHERREGVGASHAVEMI